jgi:hypothetical protein
MRLMLAVADSLRRARAPSATGRPFASTAFTDNVIFSPGWYEDLSNENVTVLATVPVTSIATAGETLVAVAAVAGTFIVGTLGIGALILAAGFKAMINAMGSVTQAAISIMTILNTMPVNTDIGRKSEAFATILKSLSDILNVIGVMTEKLMPEIDNVWDLIWGSSFTDKLIIVAGIINDMIGSANKGTGIMGIVKTISDSLTGMARLPASPVVDAFVKIMKVLPDIITAMTPSEEMMDALTGFWVKVEGFRV